MHRLDIWFTKTDQIFPIYIVLCLGIMCVINMDLISIESAPRINISQIWPKYIYHIYRVIRFPFKICMWPISLKFTYAVHGKLDKVHTFSKSRTRISSLSGYSPNMRKFPTHFFDLVSWDTWGRTLLNVNYIYFTNSNQPLSSGEDS